MKLGSLFDGSGGFPLAGSLCGIEPVWASEVEPYPISVTRSRFPNMKHLGSITDVNGAEIEPVDVITFGSPCQDLSVAGKRAGLKHEDNGDDETTRSGLFMEAVRIIREMREKTNGEYPRYAVWENVPGAFSSNKGEDFRIVLEELIKIVEPTAVMPEVPKNGWAYADSYTGDGWSLAYRVFDAQYWGVPQRRRRIYLVADFRGECAREILFERESLRGYFTQSRPQRETVTRDSEGSIGTADRTNECVAYGISSFNSNAMLSDNPHSGIYEADTSRTLDLNGGNPACNQGGIAICEPIGVDGFNQTLTGSISKTMTSISSDYHHVPCTLIPYTLKIRSGCEGGGKGALVQDDMSATLATNNDQYLFQPIIDGNILDDQGGSVMNIRTDGKSPTIRAQMGGHPPVVLNPMIFKADDGSTGDVSPTLVGDHNNRVTDHTVLVCEPTYIIDGDKLGKAEREGGSGLGVREGDKMYTLTAKDRHSVAYLASGKPTSGCLMASGYEKLGAQEMFSGDYTVIEEKPSEVKNLMGDDVVGTLMARDYKGVGRYDTWDRLLCYRQGGFGEYVEGNAGTVRASGGDYGGGSENLIVDPHVRYIVRRLTPTECARLQGFPDLWGHPNEKDDFTDEEYRFWLDVRNTHAEINGKQTKEYTKTQMLTWYNKLHTDSSEYKMWGNGIALPNALYVMQGIAYGQ